MGDLDDTVREAGFAGGDRIVRRVGEEGTGPRVAGAEGLVHAQEGRGEEGGFGATGAGVDFEEAGEMGEGVGWGEGAFEGGCQVGEGGGRGAYVG